MSYLGRGFLHSAHRRNELYCRIDAAPIASVFFVFFYLFLTLQAFHYFDYPGRAAVDLPPLRHARNTPFVQKEDSIVIAVTRDGSVYFRAHRILPEELPLQIQEALTDGSEPRIYLNADARCLYAYVNNVVFQVQKARVTDVTILAERPRYSAPEFPPSTVSSKLRLR